MTAPALPGAAPDPAPGRNDPARLPPALMAALDIMCDESSSLSPAVIRHHALAIRAFLARALGGGGEPVAWAVFAEDASVPAYVSSVKDRADQVVDSPAGRDECYRLVPLYTRPAATGDTGEGDGALIGEAFGLIGHVVNHARRSTNIDGTRRRLGDDEACVRNWIALVDKCEALLAARAATGGPDAR